MDDKAKKSTYNADAQKKYNKKFKFISIKLPAEEGEAVKQHYTQKGFTSANSYILSLIRADMSTAAEAAGSAADDTKDR